MNGIYVQGSATKKEANILETIQMILSKGESMNVYVSKMDFGKFTCRIEPRISLDSLKQEIAHVIKVYFYFFFKLFYRRNNVLNLD